MKKISIVVPIYNEEESIPYLYKELDEVCQSLPNDYELIFINDGSKDKSLEVLESIANKDDKVFVIEFRRNFGQTAAMAAGLEHTTGDVVVTMDGDLQNDPREIPKMLRKLNEGYDMVAGWRKDRKDKFISRKLPSMIANWIISRSTNVHLHDYGCTLKMLTGELARNIKLYGEMHRFIPALADQYGAKIAELPVNHRERQFGTTKYGISRTIRVVLDLITIKYLLGYSKRPIHLFGTVGIVTSLIGFLCLFYASFEKIFFSVAMGSRPLLSLGVMMITIGMQFLVFGLLAEVLARTYYESQDKRTYSVRRIINKNSKKTDKENLNLSVVN